MLLKALGVNTITFDENIVLTSVEVVIELGAVIAAWWYNNSFTEKAKAADAFFKQLKEGDANV